MGCRPGSKPSRVSGELAGSNDTKVNPCPESEFPATGSNGRAVTSQVVVDDQGGCSNDHREREPRYSPFGASTNHQGGYVVLDVPDHLVELIDVKGAMWSPAPDLVDRFAAGSPDLVDFSGVDEEGRERFSAFVTKLLDLKRTRSDPKAREAVRKEGRALADIGTWDEKTAQELEKLLER